MRKHALAVSIVTMMLTTGCAKSPDSTVKSFYTSVGKGEITEAQTYLSSQVRGMIGPQKLSAVLAKESERVGRCGGIKSIDVKLEGQGEVRSGTATVSYSGECPPQNENVKLTKEDGKWKLATTK